MSYIPTYTIRQYSHRYLLLRKLATFERHFYHSKEYLYDGSEFWLVLNSACDRWPVELELLDLLEIARKYAQSEGYNLMGSGWKLSSH